MREIAKGYDSALDQVFCDWCDRPLATLEDKIIFGTGNSLLVIFHPACLDRLNESGRQIFFKAIL